MKYRRRIKSDTWHFVSSCRWWPRTNYKAALRSTGEICNECVSKYKKRKKELPPADVQTSRENTLYDGD